MRLSCFFYFFVLIRYAEIQFHALSIWHKNISLLLFSFFWFGSNTRNTFDERKNRYRLDWHGLRTELQTANMVAEFNKASHSWFEWENQKITKENTEHTATKEKKIVTNVSCCLNLLTNEFAYLTTFDLNPQLIE